MHPKFEQTADPLGPALGGYDPFSPLDRRAAKMIAAAEALLDLPSGFHTTRFSPDGRHLILCGPGQRIHVLG